MKVKVKVWGSLLCGVLALFPACKKTTGCANSRDAVDWKGIYSGVVPCADCEGVQTTIVLNGGSYELYMNHLGKGGDVIQQKDTFVWNDAGSEITLKGINDRAIPSKYKVGENRLFQLDRKGKRMAAETEPEYTLAKISDVVEKYWKLVELNGEEVAVTENMMREPHFVLKAADARVQGHGGCNGFFGTYVIKTGRHISFSQMGSTMMACPDSDIEFRFMQALGETETYEVSADKLTLLGKEGEVVARLVAVCF